MKGKKILVAGAIVAVGLLMLLIPGLEPLGAITLLGGIGTWAMD